MKTLPTAFRGLVGTVTDRYTVIAEHSRLNELQGSVWEIHLVDEAHTVIANLRAERTLGALGW